MRIQRSTRVAVGLTLAACIAIGMAGAAQEKPLAQKPYERLIYSLKGPDLYRAHCAACHGPEGKGNGPVASALKAKPADLTVLAKNNGGKFPEEQARKFISGDEVVASHGSREMPVWGPIFHQVEEDKDFGDVRIQNLIKYLEAIQQK
jgi:mono/diheme cytochrome c family protein